MAWEGEGGERWTPVSQTSQAPPTHPAFIHLSGQLPNARTTSQPPRPMKIDHRGGRRNIRTMAPPGGRSVKRLPCPPLETHVHTTRWSHQLRLLPEQRPGEGLSADLGCGLGPPALRAAGGHRGGSAPLLGHVVGRHLRFRICRMAESETE